MQWQEGVFGHWHGRQIFPQNRFRFPCPWGKKSYQGTSGKTCSKSQDKPKKSVCSVNGNKLRIVFNPSFHSRLPIQGYRASYRYGWRHNRLSKNGWGKASSNKLCDTFSMNALKNNQGLHNLPLGSNLSLFVLTWFASTTDKCGREIISQGYAIELRKTFCPRCLLSQ